MAPAPHHVDGPAALLTARASGPLRGVITAPGDKSISHRALILGALAEGVTEIDGLLEGDDVLRTAAAMRAFGAEVERIADGRWRVRGTAGAFSEPEDVIDCGNAGTGVRLILGAAAGFELTASFTGDASLRRRPMNRVLVPLQNMGARTTARNGGRLPVTVRGGQLSGFDHWQQVPSAQVKSAILLAGLNATGTTSVYEPEPTRDHTERMLQAFGASLFVEDREDCRAVHLNGKQRLFGTGVCVPGDPSSAAFPLVAALLTPESDVTVEGVLLNPLRTGLFDTLVEMGADLAVSNRRDQGGEPVGDLRARFSKLHGIDVPPERAPSMIDEYPILAVAAAFADGPTRLRGLAEMRVKESDRLALMAAGLTACGVQVEEAPDALTVVGTARGNHPVRGGAEIATHGDHRIAMSHLTLGLAAREPVTVDQARMIATSFPGFVELMRGLGAEIA